MVPAPLDVRIVANVTDWIGLFTTLLATIVGGVLAVISTVVINKKAADRERREREELATSRASVKIYQLANSAAGFHRSAERDIANAMARRGNDDFELYSVMRPFTSTEGQMHIDSDDLIVLVRAKEFQLLDRILFLFGSYNAMLGALDFYRAHRQELMSKITPVSMRGTIGDIVLSEQEAHELAPAIAVANELATELRNFMRAVNDDAISILSAFGPAVKKYLGDGATIVPGINPLNDQPGQPIEPTVC